MFEEHHRAVWRLLRRLGTSPDTAADLVQETYLIAAERLSDIRAESEKAFLFGTAIRLARSSSRRERRCQLDDDMDARQIQGIRLEEIADRRRAVSMMDEILSKLEPDLVTVFVLYELEEMTTVDIAKLLQIPNGTVASRLRRAREAFRNYAERAERALRQMRQS